MTTLEASISNIIQFLKYVQESCENYRLSMEICWNQEYQAYLHDWHQQQNELKKEAQKKAEVKSAIDEIVEEIEEFSLADSLIEKARKIRKQSEKLVNGISNPRRVTSNEFSNAQNEAKLRPKESTEVRSKNSKSMPHSKSDLIAQPKRCKPLPRSKSSSSAPLKRTLSKTLKSRSNRSSSFSPCHAPQENSKSPNVAVISSADLECFKKQSVKSPEEDVPKSSSALDAGVSKHVAVYPVSKSKLIGNIIDELFSTHIPFKTSLWYPHLSLPHAHLLSIPVSHQQCSHKKMFRLLNEIQETLMWLDLLWMVEKNVFPNIVYNEKNVETLRVCSYLLSLFHQYSQRVPMLCPS